MKLTVNGTEKTFEGDQGSRCSGTSGTSWGWFYLSTILDDFSRYIVAWKLCTTMKAGDVTETLTKALQASGLESAKLIHRPRLLSDNGSSYIAGDLAEWLDEQNITHIRGAPNYPQTQGKIERWHQTLKNRILLENDYLPSDLEAQIEDFVGHCNHRRYHESLGNLTLANVYRERQALTQPMSTSGVAKPSCWREEGSRNRPSKNAACYTRRRQHKIQPE